MIGREGSPLGELVLPLDGVKQTVRLAGGPRDGSLDAASRERGLAALAMFGERLRSFAPEAVRAVARTRCAWRATPPGSSTAEAALGLIEVISGLEEARLIYLGAAHELPSDGVPRLVVDIGGGSTECIVGTDMRASTLESAPVGCVALSTRHFPEGCVGREAFEHAYYAARAIFAQVAEPFAHQRWRYAVGTSGTAKSLWQVAQAQWGVDELDRDSLARIHAALIEAGHVDAVPRRPAPDRRPVLAGGLAVMMAAFDELGIDTMRYCGGALRQGVLYDMLGRSEGRDTRAITVEQMLARYGVDRRHARRVRDTALALFDQGARAAQEVLQARRQVLAGWSSPRSAGRSRTVASQAPAYILGHADMPGPRREQAALANLALAQIGGCASCAGSSTTTSDG